MPRHNCSSTNGERERQLARLTREEGASLNNSCCVRSWREGEREKERGGHDYSPVRRDLGAAVVARAAGGLFVAVAREGGGEGGGEKTRVRVSSIMMSSLPLSLCLKARPITFWLGDAMERQREGKSRL